ncbi:MAG TPA: hypothetical protein PK573_03215 [Spirochaetota bacterium]|nr:hypothetical protein [Spirochaetota bacterium]HRZ27485.1 hypothetical protein [Spirochaetota bacterium]HSA14211.1 hypothetical protein [Spirochaetota bacterium]
MVKVLQVGPAVLGAVFLEKIAVIVFGQPVLSIICDAAAVAEKE